MSLSEPDAIPSHYELYADDGSYNQSIAPLYLTMTDKGPQFGLRVEKQHLNPMGICHGGVYMVLMDMALSGVICHQLGKYIGTPTISISLDYMAASKPGEWLYADTESLRVSKSIGFASGVIRNAAGDVKVRASGTFKLPADIDAAPGISVAELLSLQQAGEAVPADPFKKS